MPPCERNLALHSRRANYVAYLFRDAHQLNMNLDNPAEHGWKEDGKVIWSSISFPEDVSELLLNLENDVSGDSDDEDNLEDDMDIEIEDDTEF